LSQPNSKTSKLTFLKGAAVWLESGILENIINSGENVLPDDLWTLKHLNNQLSDVVPYCVLITSGHLASISKEAMELSASAEFAETTIAKALMVNSIGHRLVANFYVTVSKPRIRTKVFSDREKALEWLRNVRDGKI
jgi:hypothetical protein